ncbi:hypothetical protein K7432_016887 [Basidiobolus ranarum]|uniref:Uncharacterized protein n=1 Tax=Basidiobolus ranarum TaxID=34480 RepID=A0ABR2WE49_9FUNG
MQNSQVSASTNPTSQSSSTPNKPVETKTPQNTANSVVTLYTSGMIVAASFLVAALTQC